MTTELRPYQRCVRTVMDTTDPDIWFDENGVSNHALFFDKEIGPYVEQAARGERLGELDALVAEIKRSGEGKPYDCIIGISGGVDSTYLALQAVKLGLRPLAVHFDSGWNSELAVNNIENVVQKLHLDLVTDVVDWREMRDLQLSFFKASVMNCDIPTDHAFATVAFKQAVKYGIKYVLSGQNMVSESSMPAAWVYPANDARHVRGIQRRFGSVPLKTYPTLGRWKRYFWYGIVRGVKSVTPLDYLPYDYREAKQVITEELDWRDYGGKHYESVFTRYYQGHYLPEKFGIDKRKAHLSSLILSKQLDRADAVRQLDESPYNATLPAQDHAFIAKKLGVSTDELEEIFARPPVPHDEYPHERWLWPFTLRLLRLAARVKNGIRR